MARHRGAGAAPAWGAGLLVGLLFTAEFICLYLGLQYTSGLAADACSSCRPSGWPCCYHALCPARACVVRQWAGLAALLWVWRGHFTDSLAGRAQAALPYGWWGDLLALGRQPVLVALTTVAIRSTRVGRMAPEQQLLFQVSVSSLLLPGVSLALGESWLCSGNSAPLPGCRCSSRGWWALLPATWPGWWTLAQLPGDEDFRVCVPDARFRLAVWCGLAGRADHPRPARARWRWWPQALCW